MDKMKVLLAETNTSVRQFIRYTLQEHFPHFEFEVATNGKNIQKRVEETTFDIIIYESEMPMLSGKQFLEWRKVHPTLSRIPVAIITADSSADKIKTAIELGANAYLIKPLLMDHLVAKIRELMGMRKQDPKDRRKSDRIKAEGRLSLRYEDKICLGHLVNISPGGILGVFNGRNGLPHVLENVKVDIDMKNGQRVQDLSADVIRIQAVNSMQGHDFVQLVIKFDDSSNERKKKEFDDILSRIQPVVVAR